ncbi:MAG: hypothetical protein KGH69_04735 [Candidatus Micrarchaeota archaeon]|nr:hypothetical protein [Candidatus Micrarchaeota archaeon]
MIDASVQPRYKGDGKALLNEGMRALRSGNLRIASLCMGDASVAYRERARLLRISGDGSEEHALLKKADIAERASLGLMRLRNIRERRYDGVGIGTAEDLRLAIRLENAVTK